MVQKLIDEIYGDFKDVVAEGRKAAHQADPSKVSSWEEVVAHLRRPR